MLPGSTATMQFSPLAPMRLARCTPSTSRRAPPPQALKIKTASCRDQVGFSVKDTGGGVFNFTLNSFAKLRVEQGGFRLRNTSAVLDERMFGAVPLATLADAITLDGGGVGTNQTITLHANRGIT